MYWEPWITPFPCHGSRRVQISPRPSNSIIVDTIEIIDLEKKSHIPLIQMFLDQFQLM